MGKYQLMSVLLSLFLIVSAGVVRFSVVIDGTVDESSSDSTSKQRLRVAPATGLPQDSSAQIIQGAASSSAEQSSRTNQSSQTTLQLLQPNSGQSEFSGPTTTSE